jgi:competence protein ComEC
LIQIPPLVLVALFYISGIIIGTNIPISLPVIICFLLVFTFLLNIFIFLKKHPKIRFFSIYASLLLFSILYTNAYFHITFSNIEEFKNTPVKLTGVIISKPNIGKWQTSLVVKAEKLKLSDGKEIQPVRGRVFIRVRFPKKEVLYGEKYSFSGVLRVPPEGNFKDYLQRHRIAATMNVWDRKRVEYIGEEGGNPLIKTSLKIKNKLVDVIEDYISPNYSPMLVGMMLKKGATPAQIREMFAQIGVVHILAISGLHVGIMSGIFLIIFRLFSIPKRISYSIVFVLVTIYAFITGLGIPIVRAALMINLFLLGYIIRRKTNVFITLAIASLVILLWNPYYLFEVGFQLSFITVLCIVLVAPKLEKIFRLKPIWPVRAFLVSSAAWLGSLPLVAYYFGYISWVGPFSNLIVIPLVTLILTFGFILLLSILILPFLSYFLATIVKLLLFLLLKIASDVSSWPFVYSKLPTFDISIVIVYYLALIMLLYYADFKRWIKGLKNVS